MSNPCFNLLVVSGNPAELADLRMQIRGEYSDGTECPFDFSAVLPVPDPEPFDWRYENWGTERLPIYCDVEKARRRSSVSPA